MHYSVEDDAGDKLSTDSLPWKVTLLQFPSCSEIHLSPLNPCKHENPRICSDMFLKRNSVTCHVCFVSLTGWLIQLSGISGLPLSRRTLSFMLSTHGCSLRFPKGGSYSFTSAQTRGRNRLFYAGNKKFESHSHLEEDAALLKREAGSDGRAPQHTHQ